MAGPLLTGPSALQHQLWLLRSRGFDARITDGHAPGERVWQYRLTPPGVYRDRVVSWAERMSCRDVAVTADRARLVVTGDSTVRVANLVELVLEVLDRPEVPKEDLSHSADVYLDRVAALVGEDAPATAVLYRIRGVLRESGRDC